MKIGIVCFPTVGGSGVIATELGLVLARRGHEVHFISSSVPWRLDLQAPNVFFHGDPVDVDVVHVHYGALALGPLPKAPLVVTLHGTDVTRIEPETAAALRPVLQKAFAVTTPSKFLQAAAKERFGVDAQVIGNFVDTERFAPGRIIPPVLFHASNFRPIKRVPDVVRVFAEVRKQRDCTLVLAGEGPETPVVEALVRSLGLSAHVKFLGPRRDVADLLKEARVFLLPSESESFGLAALEAQSAGVPVVASRVGGLPEVVRDGVTGYLCPMGDVGAMAAAVVRAFDDEQMRKRARENAIANHCAASRVDAYERIYAEAVA